MYKFFTTIGDEVNVSVTFSHTPAEPMTHDHPGVDEEVEIESVLIDDCESKNVNDSLSEETWNRLYEECETWTERQDEPVKGLEFAKCAISGHLKASGAKGLYWVMDGAWVHMKRVVSTDMGPKVEDLGSYYEIEDAIKDANDIDKAKDDE